MAALPQGFYCIKRMSNVIFGDLILLFLGVIRCRLRRGRWVCAFYNSEDNILVLTVDVMHISFGAIFSLVMMVITWLLKRYLFEVQTSEMFMTAKRTVKTGLVASAIVSSWTWAATLLTSTEVAYRYGVSGPLWYASGACVQVLLFSVLAIELKRRAPNAHTYLEVREKYS